MAGRANETFHQLVIGDARDLSAIPGESVDLVVTSPPYPMIRMWDGLFGRMNPEVEAALSRQDGPVAFELMHAELEKVWGQLWRVLKAGSWVCVNIGDATRRIGNRFRLYSNHSRITQSLQRLGFQTLPLILWRKQTNAPNKFLGSGMLPAGAYVTLEHEYILIFRKGGRRVFGSPPESGARRASAMFWEERNVWYSDVWDFKGIRQSLSEPVSRERSAAFPFELAYRLVNMYSVRSDRVLDPFLGTGTTMFAAMASGRHSIGIELDSAFAERIGAEAEGVARLANGRIAERLEAHAAFMADYEARKGAARHRSRHYGFPVVTAQERDILLPLLAAVRQQGPGAWTVEYEIDPQTGATSDCPG